MHSHFRVQPNCSVEVVFRCIVVGVVTINRYSVRRHLLWSTKVDLGRHIFGSFFIKQSLNLGMKHSKMWDADRIIFIASPIIYFIWKIFIYK